MTWACMLSSQQNEVTSCLITLSKTRTPCGGSLMPTTARWVPQPAGDRGLCHVKIRQISQHGRRVAQLGTAFARRISCLRDSVWVRRTAKLGSGSFTMRSLSWGR